MNREGARARRERGLERRRMRETEIGTGVRRKYEREEEGDLWDNKYGGDRHSHGHVVLNSLRRDPELNVSSACLDQNSASWELEDAGVHRLRLQTDRELVHCDVLSVVLLQTHGFRGYFCIRKVMLRGPEV